jgi:hypothetical protein
MLILDTSIPIADSLSVTPSVINQTITIHRADLSAPEERCPNSCCPSAQQPHKGPMGWSLWTADEFSLLLLWGFKYKSSVSRLSSIYIYMYLDILNIRFYQDSDKSPNSLPSRFPHPRDADGRPPGFNTRTPTVYAYGQQAEPRGPEQGGSRFL